jgi:hypothetical protein
MITIFGAGIVANIYLKINKIQGGEIYPLYLGKVEGPQVATSFE